MWLCQPGQSPDPCNASLSTTVFSPTLHKLKVIHPARVKKPAIDCFYVYPTVSDQKTTLANLHIDPEERSIALYQAARYSQYCRVFAPMYRQVTVTALDSGNTESPKQLAIPVNDVRAAFATYLRKYNHGRGFVLIGHSQGSFVLEQLIAKDIDRKPAVRKRLVSAILLGGNVLVRRRQGASAAPSSTSPPAGRHPAGLRDRVLDLRPAPPANSLFGRTTVAGDSALHQPGRARRRRATSIRSSPRSRSPAERQTRLVDRRPQDHPAHRRRPPGSQSRAPTARTARRRAAPTCSRSSPWTAPRAPQPSPDPTWGLHLLDANVALGNLVSVVHSEIDAYAARPAAPLAPASGSTSR